MASYIRDGLKTAITAKLAHLEGIDFILDSLGQKVSEDLSEHIDGFKSYIHVYQKILSKKSKETLKAMIRINQ